MSLRIRTREALPTDKKPVLEFCRDTWPGGDYIQDVWDNWILNRNGRFIVATKDGVPVAIAHASFQTRDVVWLEGLRVRPDCRGFGIAGRLNRSLVKTAAQRGASVARLSTAISNRASRRHVEKVGFKLVASFGRFEQKTWAQTAFPARSKAKNLPARDLELDKVNSRLQQVSFNVLRRMDLVSNNRG